MLTTFRPPANQSLDINANQYNLDEEGFLLDISDWLHEVTSGMAMRDGVELEPEHWEVIIFLRKYYLEYQIAPAMHVLSRETGKRSGAEKGNS